MKVVATTALRTYLVEMTSDEIAKVCKGESSGYNLNLKVGDTLNVDNIYNRLKGLDGNKDRLSQMAVTLRSMANLLETQEPIMNGLTAEQAEQEGKE